MTCELEFNPNEPFLLPNGRALKYAFYEGTDFLEGTKMFDLLCYNSVEAKYVPLSELMDSPESLARQNTGREVLDETGMVIMADGVKTTMFSVYSDGDPDIFSMNSLQSYRVRHPSDRHMQVSAFSLLLDHWLPMPMFRKEVDGISDSAPLGWCRMRMSELGDGKQKGAKRYRLVWAFDTATSDDMLSMFRPYVENGSEQYGLCNMPGLLLGFLSSSDEFHAFSDYLESLLGLDGPDGAENWRYKAFYIYFINFLRLSGGAPEVMLHTGTRDLFVDLVLDIGNSRTCGVLFENGKFTDAEMLELRDLSKPWITYENRSFDMRVAFRKADFGNDILLDEEMFQWQSMVRVGEEARRLIYRSLEEEGMAEKTTNYSSPKRYLWDLKPFDGQWENLITVEDSSNGQLSRDIYVPELTTHFRQDGSYTDEDESALSAFSQYGEGNTHRYSRSSLMTFALIEIFQQALQQVNSVKFRNKWGNKDCRRCLRNVIITSPTAMPQREQMRLRECADEAFRALCKCRQKLQKPDIIPSAQSLAVTDVFADNGLRVWSYDEASCCQLVYLYAEIGNRFQGEIHKFFDLKGRIHPELASNGRDGKTLVVGSVDIGAGTSDVMVCAYQCDEEGSSMLKPYPLFWDSFYLAGDDILRNIIQSFVIEGKNHDSPELGSVASALAARIMACTDEELAQLPCMDNLVYRSMINDLRATDQLEEKNRKKQAFASNLIHDFFGADSSMMGYIERRCRNDFNLQVSLPIAQFYMDLVRKHRPSKLYTFDDLFPEIKPASYLLDHFEHHFGFRFERLSWRFDPQEVNDVVKATMEPLLKQLAVVLHKKRCDIIVLAGRPTSLDAITELFVKHMPATPDRLVRLNDYQVGWWFPTADGQGFFYDQKSIVAVGGMVGYLASHAGLKGMGIDFTQMIQRMKSTANYMGLYKDKRRIVERTVLSPHGSMATLQLSEFPAFIGCRQLDSPSYQARPLYAIYNNSGHHTLSVSLSRSFYDNREELHVEDVTDNEGNTLPKSSVELVQQSLVSRSHWLDNGEFELTVRN